ncbi:hypothetical protein F2P56_022510 [Juglans regia]|uniref:DUF4283 domain-containing protein n=2 Tax=Juglans regia TaxID=51240 RepID=A0A833X4Q7_JUGRE|nr:uncharacterized protein LOC109007959 [Juglans regia]KAF5458486.1 hypothetical protein F2P56_022510 [Juglans regia]
MPATKARSFVDLVMTVPQPIPEVNLPMRSPNMIEGQVCFMFSKEEMVLSAEPFRYSLVLKFLKQRHSLDAIRMFIRVRWGLMGNAVVSSMSKNHNVFIRLTSEEDFNKAFSREASEINGVSYRVFHWTPGFTKEEETPIVPVWVMLPGLPPNFYHNSILKILTAPLGKFIRSDNSTRCTTRTDGARVCLEMDASKQHLDSFWIGTPSSSFKQDVVFETLPTFCSSCKLQGHNKTTSGGVKITEDQDVAKNDKVQEQGEERLTEKEVQKETRKSQVREVRDKEIVIQEFGSLNSPVNKENISDGEMEEQEFVPDSMK